MSDLFYWRIRLEETYAKRAEECRWLAEVCSEHLRESYLKLAAEYEQLAKEAARWTSVGSRD